MAEITVRGQAIITALMATIGEERIREIFSGPELDVVATVEPEEWPPEIREKVQETTEEGWGSLNG
ncbi:MAG: hypothetical protein JSS45_01825 [Proteobacteria bacterium]|nr:hypothetical protein [Pseudomonadota bacterium]